MKMLKKILVTGAGGAAAANFIRSLKDAPEKIKIIGTDINKYHLELSEASIKYTVPPVSSPDYLPSINKIIKKEKIDYVHPQPDLEVAFLSKNRERLLTPLFLSSEKIVQTCQNKMSLMQILQKNNLPIPESYHIQDKKDLKAKTEDMLQKHKKLWVRAIKGAGSKGSIPIKSVKQTENWIQYWKEMKNLDYNDFMISEFLPGKEFAFQSIWKNGKLIMSQARERCEYLFGNLTVSGQSSSPSIAVTVQNQQLNQICYKTIKTVDPQATGIFCVDLKTDSKGQIKVTEINIGRFFTTSYFFTKAGINMPYYYIKLALDEEIPKTIKRFNNIEPGLYWIRLMDMGYKLLNTDKWSSRKI